MRAPLDGTIRVTPHGAFGYLRDDPSSGLCSDGHYPCVHKGVDLAGAEGTIVKAPERGLVFLAANRNDLKPFSRYGPAFVYMKGYETGLWHLLAHLKAGSIRTAGGGYPDERGEGGHQTILVLGSPYPVAEGQYLGVISDRNHLHWEINTANRAELDASVNDPEHWWKRTSAFSLRAAAERIDPMKVLKGTYAEGQTSIGGSLLLLALLWLLKDN
jgi:hypothetical protein